MGIDFDLRSFLGPIPAPLERYSGPLFISPKRREEEANLNHKQSGARRDKISEVSPSKPLHELSRY